MKDVNHPSYWQDAVHKPMWVIRNGEPVRELLFIKNRGKGKTARCWTTFNGGGWLYYHEKHVDWFLSAEDCDKYISEETIYAEAKMLVQIDTFHLAQGRQIFRELARKKFKDLPNIPEEAARAARQYIINQREIRKSK